MGWQFSLALTLAILCHGCNRRTPSVAKTDEPPTAEKKPKRKDNKMGSTAPQKVFGPMMLDEEAVAGQIQNLSSSQIRQRFLACETLKTMGPKAKSAVKELKRVAARDPDAKVREAAKRALASIEGTEDG